MFPQPEGCLQNQSIYTTKDRGLVSPSIMMDSPIPYASCILTTDWEWLLTHGALTILYFVI